MTEQRETTTADVAHQRVDAEWHAPSPWLAVKTLCWREMVRFFRQRDRILGPEPLGRRQVRRGDAHALRSDARLPGPALGVRVRRLHDHAI